MKQLAMRYPSKGYVNLWKVEQTDPRMPVLLAVDSTLSRASRYEEATRAVPVNMGAELYIDKAAAFGSIKMRTDLQESQRRNLEAIGATVISELTQRLELSDQGQLDTIRSERTAAGDQEFRSAEQNLEDQAIADANQNDVDSARVATLRMQIAAMELNEQPPPTAPRGYWAKILEQRQADLDDALVGYNAQLNLIYAKRDSLIRQERMEIDADVESDMGEAKASIDSNRAKVVAQAEERLKKEQSNLNAEDDRVFRDAEDSVKSGAVGVLGTSLDKTVVVADGPIVQNLAALASYRAHLQASILAEAGAKVNEVSKELHIKIVEKHAGIQDVTAVVLKSIKDRNWKVS